MIRPTRALDSTGEKLGKLSVFSEPPGLEVALEGTLIGKTPIFVDEVKPGSHRLRIKNSETDITIEPGKTLQISLYKDKFILIPAADKKPPKQPEPVETDLTKSKPPPPPAEEQRLRELSPIERYRLLGHY
ncbi:MAG: PEGA domain-containing protein [Desulfobacterales bacterium]